MVLERTVPETEAGLAVGMRMTELGAGDCRNDGECEHQRATAVEEKSELCHREHLLPLEPEVLESFCRLAVQNRCATLVAAPGRQVTLGDPRGRTMRRRRQLGKFIFGVAECRFGLVEPLLQQQGATEYQAGIADL